MSGQILMVVTNTAAIDADHPTGVWLAEFAEPYRIFREAGVEVVVASPAGGGAPCDPRSEDEKSVARFAAERRLLESTAALGRVDAASFDAIFFPGGHGAMFDLPDNPVVSKAVSEVWARGGVVAAVCHGPAGLVGPTDETGAPLVRCRRVTCFSDEEERATGLDRLMPFLLESRLRELGAEVGVGPKFEAHTVVDGRLVTGQNPASSEGTARAVLEALGGAAVGGA